MNTVLTIKKNDSNELKCCQKQTVIEKISSEETKMDLEISSIMYNNTVPVDDNFSLD